MTSRDRGPTSKSVKRREVALRALEKEVILMRKHHKSTPKRRRKPVSAELMVKLVLAFASLLTGTAALIQALKH